MIRNRKVDDANTDADGDNNDALEAVPTDVYWSIWLQPILIFHQTANKDKQPSNKLEFRNIGGKIKVIIITEYSKTAGEMDSNPFDEDFKISTWYQQKFDQQVFEDRKYFGVNHKPANNDDDSNLGNNFQNDHFDHPDAISSDNKEDHSYITQVMMMILVPTIQLYSW